ncbi:hypothetical protein K3495_g11449 [Podosphaera aphanis]|nr:hypothetical protein K3495_g11449 [Podosphaera aphanis]
MGEQTMNYESLADAFRHLTDDNNVKLFSSLVKSIIPSLRQQLHQREEELEENPKKIEKSENETESVHKVLLSTHHKVAKEFERDTRDSESKIINSPRQYQEKG